MIRSRKRYLLADLANNVRDIFEVQEKEVLLEFLKRWLKADPNIFLDQNRFKKKSSLKIINNVNRTSNSTNDYHNRENICLSVGQPEIFVISDFMKAELEDIDDRNGPAELSVSRWVLLEKLDEFCWANDNIAEEVAIILGTARFDQDIACVHLSEIIDCSDLSKEQWFYLRRIAVTMELAIRFCFEVYHEVPDLIKFDFEVEYTKFAGTGPKVDEMPIAETCYEHLKWLYTARLHKPRAGGVVEAAELIKSFWNVDRTVNAIRIAIDPDYKEIVKNGIPENWEVDRVDTSNMYPERRMTIAETTIKK